MQSSELLEAIWRGDVACAGDGEAAEGFGQLLDALMPMRRVALARGDRGGVQLLPEHAELLPALPLGCVIEEEIDVAAPYGALVLIFDRAALRPGAGAAARSNLAGHLVGELLVDAVQRGVFPVEQETDALYLLALAYDDLAQSPRLRGLGLDPAPFRAGLAAVLASIWTGPMVRGSEPDMLLGGPMFLRCPRLRAYLRMLDASFTAPVPGRATAALVGFEAEARGHDDWLRAIGARMGAFLCACAAEGQTASEG